MYQVLLRYGSQALTYVPKVGGWVERNFQSIFLGAVGTVIAYDVYSAGQNISKGFSPEVQAEIAREMSADAWAQSGGDTEKYNAIMEGLYKGMNSINPMDDIIKYVVVAVIAIVGLQMLLKNKT